MTGPQPVMNHQGGGPPLMGGPPAPHPNPVNHVAQNGLVQTIQQVGKENWKKLEEKRKGKEKVKD